MVKKYILHHNRIPKNIGDADLAAQIKEDRDRLCFTNAELLEKTGIRQKIIRPYLTGRHSMSEEVRSAFIKFHNEIFPDCMPNNAKYSWLFFLEPVAEFLVDDTFAHAQQVLKDTKANVLLIRPAPEERVRAVITREEFEEEFRKVRMQSNIELGGLARKYSGNYETVRWDDCLMPKVRAAVKSGYALMTERVTNVDKITRVLLDAPSLPGDARAEHAEFYAEHSFPQRVATDLFLLLKKYIQKDFRILDVGTGPGTLAITVARLAREEIFEGKDCIRIIAAEDVGEKAFLRILGSRIKRFNLEKSVEASGFPYGRDKIWWHGSNFDVVVWNLILPSIKALRAIPKVLKTNGLVAVSRLDVATLKALYGIVLNAVNDCAGMQTTLPRTELQDLHDLAEYISEKIPTCVRGSSKIEMEIILKFFKFYEDVEFETSEAFLEFLEAAFPFTVRCFAAFRKYPKALESIKEWIKKHVEKHYSSPESPHINLRFGINFVVGQYKEPQDLRLKR